MFRFKISSDSIQFGILVLGGLSMTCGFWGYCEGHFAKASDLQNETEERRELKMEVDALYLKQIPKSERMQLKFSNKGETDVSK